MKTSFGGFTDNELFFLVMNFVVDLTDDDPPHPPPRSDPIGAELSVDVVDLLEDDEDDDDEKSWDQEQADDSTNESMPERVRPRHETIDIDDASDEEPEQQHMPQHASPSSRDTIPIQERHSHSCGLAKRKHETNLHEQADLGDKRRRSNEEAHSSLDEIDDDVISVDSSTSSTAPEAELEIPAQIQPIHDNAQSCSTSDDDSSDVSVNVDQSSESPTTPWEAKLTPPSHVLDICTKDSTSEMTTGRDKPIQDGHSTESGSILDETHSKMPVKRPKDNYPPIMLLASSDDDETTPCHSMKSPSSPPEADMPTLEQEGPTNIPLHAGDAATPVIYSTESISSPSEREPKVPAKKSPPFLDSSNGYTRYDQSWEEPATLPVQIPARAPHASEAPFPQLVVDLTEDNEEEPNFILIESSDEEDEEHVEPETAETAIPIPNQTNYVRGQRYRKPARRWNVRSNSDTYCPTKFQKTMDYNYGKSRSEALAEQEQLLSGAQARMRQEKERLYNLQQEQAFARDGPTFTRPITDLTKLNRNHFKWLDLHARMGLPKDATPTMIKSQYRKLALAYHPDKCKLADATTRFQAVTEAYHQLVGRGM